MEELSEEAETVVVDMEEKIQNGKQKHVELAHEVGRVQHAIFRVFLFVTALEGIIIIFEHNTGLVVFLVFYLIYSLNVFSPNDV